MSCKTLHYKHLLTWQVEELFWQGLHTTDFAGEQLPTAAGNLVDDTKEKQTLS